MTYFMNYVTKLSEARLERDSTKRRRIDLTFNGHSG
uniref:Uncharacterized protein n=1 Tax=Heterorhabditis bacteriophora TaxID=37862 RepID=A0A1I7WLL7_HETBA